MKAAREARHKGGSWVLAMYKTGETYNFDNKLAALAKKAELGGPGSIRRIQ